MNGMGLARENPMGPHIGTETKEMEGFGKLS
jgi:hypothetical protein